MATTHSTSGAAGPVEAAPEPFGAKQTEPDPRRGWAAQRARLGGYAKPVRFTAEQQAVLEAAADELIPPGRGFPAPSEVEIVEFVARYVTPADEPVKYFPLAGEYAFKDRLNALGREFVEARPSVRVERLSALEASGDEAKAEFFAQLKGLVYHGYYARPEVTAAIRRNLPAGRDYHGQPQPYGYLEVTEQWPEGHFHPDRGTFTATEDVTFVGVPDGLERDFSTPGHPNNGGRS